MERDEGNWLWPLRTTAVEPYRGYSLSERVSWAVLAAEYARENGQTPSAEVYRTLEEGWEAFVNEVNKIDQREEDG